MARLTDERIKQLRELASKATPGPWAIGVAGNSNVVHFDGDDITGVAEASPINAAFIAESRTAVPDLLDEVERLRATLAAVNEGVMTSWSDLGSLDLREGDVIDADDDRLYRAHVEAKGRAVDALRAHFADEKGQP